MAHDISGTVYACFSEGRTGSRGARRQRGAGGGARTQDGGDVDPRRGLDLLAGGDEPARSGRAGPSPGRRCRRRPTPPRTVSLSTFSVPTVPITIRVGSATFCIRKTLRALGPTSRQVAAISPMAAAVARPCSMICGGGALGVRLGGGLGARRRLQHVGGQLALAPARRAPSAPPARPRRGPAATRPAPAPRRPAPPLRVWASASRRAFSARAVEICASIFDSSVSRRLLADWTALSALARASAMSAFFCTSADCLRPMLSR